MKYIINGGVYAVDLKGTCDAEFEGCHPSIIIQSIKNQDMYYIVPLTTYTKDRWEKYRKYLCCRILSSNSIARIDKMELRHKSKIPKRWLIGNSIIVLQPDELNIVYDKIMKYLQLSLETSKKEYTKYHINYNSFSEHIKKVFLNYEYENSIFDFLATELTLICKCNLSHVTHLSFDDVKVIIWTFVPRNIVDIRYENNELLITIPISSQLVLTFMEKYGNVNLTEGHK